MDEFLLNGEVRIEGEEEREAVRRGIRRFYRDVKNTLEPVEGGLAGRQGTVSLKRCEMEEEAYVIRVKGETELVIEAGGDLGFIYALHFISERFLGVEAFWFWNDQRFVKRAEVRIPAAEYRSPKRPVKFRGWFINDEVLLSRWDAGQSPEVPWEMAFEALLRCGGNVVIPGTDRNSKRYAGLASAMGLWITHHHAEPLGAEMFLRAYPDKNPSFKENPELFRGLWEEGIKRQMGEKVIWNLGFRGQGDTPFWETDPQYDTPQKRGKLISDIMQEQYELVKKYVPDPVCCTNLYGETMELYQQGFLKLPEQVIMIWADNGYGKMVSRRQGNHNPRVTALPERGLQDRSHGVYYHVSFYDLQAANVLTMIPNSMDFVKKELENAWECGIKSLWLINCSNIKPHVYPLDFIASLWNGEGGKDGIDGIHGGPEAHLDRYIKAYYTGMPDSLADRMKSCFREYFASMIPYGEREDEHAGEQFYNYVVRVLIHGWMRDGGKRPCEELFWCAPFETFAEQLSWFCRGCEKGSGRLMKFLAGCEALKLELDGEPLPDRQASQLWTDSLLLQAKIHGWCINGVFHFARAFEAYEAASHEAASREAASHEAASYMEAFYELGQAADWYQAVDEEMKRCGHGKWKGFYDNDCQSDVKETAYLLRTLMGYVRNLSDGPYFYEWQRMVIYPERDRKILLLTNEENHLTDEELYQAMKAKQKEKHPEFQN